MVVRSTVSRKLIASFEHLVEKFVENLGR